MRLAPSGLGRRGLVLGASGLLLLLALGGAVFWLVEETRRHASENAAILERRVAISDVLSALQDAETGQRGFLLTGDYSYLEPSFAGREAFQREIPKLRNTPDQAALAEVVRLGTQRIGVLDQNLQTIERLGLAEGIQAAIARVRTGEGRRAMDGARAALRRLDAAEFAAQQAAVERLRRSSAWLQLGAVGAIGGVLLVAVVGVGLARRHNEALEQAADAVRAANDALEARVAERTADLAEANEEVQRFATIVTHDLRAPLVNVMGFTAELDESLASLRAHVSLQAPEAVPDAVRDALDREGPEALGFIRSATARMDRLINAILRLSREGRRTLRAEPVAMRPLLESLVGSLSHQLGVAQATIEIQPGLPDLEGDRLALEQVFGNLLDNAVKYLEPARPGRITVNGRDRGGFCVYEVADNGRGIEARDLTRIFEPFRRAGRQDRPGDGIGLAHVRGLVRRLGGTIACESRPGIGSVFRVTLPRRMVAADLKPMRETPLTEYERVA